MKEINIRLKTKEEFHINSHKIPFVITIDGEIQHDVSRFSIDLENDIKNIDDYTYTIERFLKYPIE